MHIELQKISKYFGKLKANHEISFSIPDSTILGILGENGAGKSTLMKILCGFIRLDSGKILIDNKDYNIGSPRTSLKLGIGMLHQDPLDFPPFKVIDNFLLGFGSSFFLNRKRAKSDFIKLAKSFDFAIDPESWIDKLTVGERQQVEIIRLIWLGVKVLILDEPTTGISAPQKIKLFSALKTLKKQGHSIIFVSHKLADVEELCDNAVILRQGKIAGQASRPFDTKTFIPMMFGDRELPHSTEKSQVYNDICLKVENLAVDGSRIKLRNINILLYKGEVLGIAGMEGSGQDLFLRACAGLERNARGKYLFDGKDMSGQSYHKYKENGLAYVPAARMEEALVSNLTISEHYVLNKKNIGPFINYRRAEDDAFKGITSYNIKGYPNSEVQSLSGGNQQRLLLSLLAENLKLMLVEHPTRGLDIESSAYIWTKLKTRCKNKASIIFISSDLDEILEYSDRVIIFFAGRLSPLIPTSQLDTNILGALIGGRDWERFDNLNNLQASGGRL